MKPSEIYDKIVTLLNAEEVEQIELAQAKLDNGTVIEADSFEAGQNIFIVTEDEKVPLPIGDYVLEDGKKLVVSEEGIIASIGLEEDDKEEAEEEKKDEMSEEVLEDLAEDKDEEMEEEKEADLEDVIESVIGALSPAIDEIKDEMAKLQEEVEELKKYKNEEQEEKELEDKEELSAQPKGFKHSPEKNAEKKSLNLYAQNRKVSVKDKALQRILNIKN